MPQPKGDPLAELPDHPSAVAITFDDGFANFAEHALPVLERLSLPATVFVISGYCGKRNNWPTQPPGFPTLPLMSWSALRDLPPLISLGAHTRTHPDLRMLAERELFEEVHGSRVEIEQNTARMVKSFAYPYGAVDAQTAAVVRREFAVACGTRLAFGNARSDRAILPRLDTFYLRETGRMGSIFSLRTRGYIALRRCLREARAAYVARSATTPAASPSQ